MRAALTHPASKQVSNLMLLYAMFLQLKG